MGEAVRVRVLVTMGWVGAYGKGGQAIEGPSSDGGRQPCRYARWGGGGSQAATGVGVKDACLAETDGAESADEASWEGPWAFREAGR